MENILTGIVVFILVVVVHEFAHGYVAFHLGDVTARNAGRLTLNPTVHIDPVGTVLLPVLLVLSSSPVIFGWAKPVPVNPRNFKDPRKGILLVSAAGPAANFLMAGIFSLLFRTGIFAPGSFVWNFLLTGMVISLVLGIFNLMPIPPLDGSGILFSLLPPEVALKMEWLRRYGFIVLIGLLYLGLFDRVIIPMVTFFIRVFAA